MYAEQEIRSSLTRRPGHQLALTLAFALAGCKSSPHAPTDDASLTAALQSRIAGDGALSTEPIQSSVQNQVATLNGTVSSEAARSLAAADAAQVAGIKTVVNNLTVQAPATRRRCRSHHRRPRLPPTSLSPPKPKPAPVVRKTPPTPAPAPAPEAAAQPPTPPAQRRTSSAATAPTTSPPPPPAFRNITLPPGTTIPIRITQTLDSATTQQGEPSPAPSPPTSSSTASSSSVRAPPSSGRVSPFRRPPTTKAAPCSPSNSPASIASGEKLAVNTDPTASRARAAAQIPPKRSAAEQPSAPFSAASSAEAKAQPSEPLPAAASEPAPTPSPAASRFRFPPKPSSASTSPTPSPSKSPPKRNREHNHQPDPATASRKSTTAISRQSVHLTLQAAETHTAAATHPEAPSRKLV